MGTGAELAILPVLGSIGSMAMTGAEALGTGALSAGQGLMGALGMGGGAGAAAPLLGGAAGMSGGAAAPVASLAESGLVGAGMSPAGVLGTPMSGMGGMLTPATQTGFSGILSNAGNIAGQGWNAAKGGLDTLSNADPIKMAQFGMIGKQIMSPQGAPQPPQRQAPPPPTSSSLLPLQSQPLYGVNVPGVTGRFSNPTLDWVNKYTGVGLS